MSGLTLIPHSFNIRESLAAALVREGQEAAAKPLAVVFHLLQSTCMRR
jgi:hypothetical protein